MNSSLFGRVRWIVLTLVLALLLLMPPGMVSQAALAGGGRPSPPLEMTTLPADALTIAASSQRPTTAIPGLDSALDQLYAAYQAGDKATLATFAGQSHIDLDSGTVRVVLEMARSPEAHPAGQSTIEVVPLGSGRTFEIHHAPPIAIRPDLATAIAATGATYETASRNQVQVLAPFASLKALPQVPGVRHVRLPYPVEPQAGSQTTQGVNLTNTNNWHAAGYTGTGINMAIFDSGFTGWAALQASGDLPSTIYAYDYSASYNFIPDTAGYQHGAACAEIAYDMAPGSTMHLFAFDTETNLDNAVNDYINSVSGKKVASLSMGWVNAGPYDGTGAINDIIDGAETAGIFWAQAAGDYRKQHWSATAVQYSATDAVDFSGGGAGNVQGYGATPGSLWNIPAGTTVSAFLEWNDWNAARTGNQNHIDYDLELYQWGGASWNYVTGSYRNQCGDSNVQPTEAIQYYSSGGGLYALVIWRWQGGGSCPNSFGHWLDLYTYNDFYVAGTGADYSFWYSNECNSLAIPADGDSAVTVSPTFWNEDGTPPLYGLESFSCLGPRNAAGGANPGTTVNKPDVVAPDGVDTATYGASNGVNYANGGTGFWGSSAAAPHVAGVAATMWQGIPGYSMAQLRSYIETRAIYKGDGGTCGGGASKPNNRYGYGRLYAGEDPTAVGLANLVATSAEGFGVLVGLVGVAVLVGIGMAVGGRRRI